MRPPDVRGPGGYPARPGPARLGPARPGPKKTFQKEPPKADPSSTGLVSVAILAHAISKHLVQQHNLHRCQAMAIATSHRYDKGAKPADGGVYSDEGDHWYCEYCWRRVDDSHTACGPHMKNLHYYNRTTEGRIDRLAIVKTCEQKARARLEEQQRLEEQLRLEEQQQQAALPPIPLAEAGWAQAGGGIPVGGDMEADVQSLTACVSSLMKEVLDMKAKVQALEKIVGELDPTKAAGSGGVTGEQLRKYM